VVSLNLVHSVN